MNLSFENYFAPLALFVFKRPDHLNKVLNALLNCEEASKTDIFIFADGVAEHSSKEDVESIRLVHKIIDNITGFKSVTVFKRQVNFGLAKSVIYGVNKVFELNKKIIVLEDDILPGRFFLRYMNQALLKYENSEDIGCIHAWNYPLRNFWFENDTYFLRGADCWGWATWKDKWKMYDGDSNSLLQTIRMKGLAWSFNDYGVHSYTKMLEDNCEELIDSWAINWRATMYLNRNFCLYPKKSLVYNLGLDGSGTHGGIHNWQTDDINWLPNQDKVSTFSSKVYILKLYLFNVELFVRKLIKGLRRL